MLIPAMLLVLAALLWKYPSNFDNWYQQTGRKSHNTYYLPVLAYTESAETSPKQQAKAASFLMQLTRYGVLIALCFVALAHPYQQGQKVPEPPRHRDIVFLVDTSITMSLRDYQIEGQRIERMTVLKRVLSHFIDKLQGNRIGLTVFSEQAYHLAPLTTDYALLKKQIYRLESAILTGRTSNPSRALLEVAKQYKNSDKKPALVLLTDIDRPHRHIDPRSAARYLAGQGFHLHTIGIGAGSEKAKDDDISSLIYQPANLRLLEEIAHAGEGKFFWTKDVGSLNQALQLIKQTEVRKTEVVAEYVKRPLYMWVLLSALVWLSGWQLLALSRVK